MSRALRWCVFAVLVLAAGASAPAASASPFSGQAVSSFSGQATRPVSGQTSSSFSGQTASPLSEVSAAPLSALPTRARVQSPDPQIQPGAGLAALGTPLPLGKLAPGTPVDRQFANDGILFSGQQPFITEDGSSTVNPVLSGTPTFNGTIVGSFIKPGTQEPATVNAFSVVVGYIDDPGSVQMTVYGRKGQQLGVLIATQVGFDQLLSTFPEAASFTISATAEEPAGWEVNTIRVGPINNAYVALGDSYSSGEGTNDFPWSTEQGTECDTGPEAWGAQLADMENNASPEALLDMGPETLIACQGEETKDLEVPRAKETEGEFPALRAFVARSGPPDLVTLTIGGNDLGFANILTACFLGGAEICHRQAYQLGNKLTTGASSLIATLTATYLAMKASAGEGSQLVVVGYPDLFSQPGGIVTAIKTTQTCPWLGGTLTRLLGGPLSISPSLNGLLWLLQFDQSNLNDDMAQAAQAAGVQFIPIPLSLQGHELCTEDPWLVPVSLVNAVKKTLYENRNIGHPNVAGSAAIASAVAAKITLASSGLEIGNPQPFVRREEIAAPQVQPTAAPRVRRALAASTLSFQGGAQPGATTGVPYVDYLLSSGGSGADKWAIASGSLPAGLSLNAQTGTITGTPTATSSSTFTVEVTDSSSPTPQSASATVSIAVEARSPLSVSTTTMPTATVGQPYGAYLQGTGGLGELTWSVTSGSLPAGLSLQSATGQIVGTPTSTAVGTADFTVSATDSSSLAEVASAKLAIVVDAASAPLTVTTTSLPGLQAGQDYLAQLTSSGGIAPTQWSIATGTLPPGIALNPATGVLSGSPTTAGTYQLSVTVSDASTPTAQTASAHLSIAIEEAGSPLSIVTSQVFDENEGEYYSSTIQVQGGVAPYRWALSAGSLPAGLVLNANTGQIAGETDATGSFPFSVGVKDAAGHVVTQSYEMSVAVSALKVSSTLAPATVGTYYTANVTPSGGAAPYEWTLTSGTLPSGLRFDASTGAIVGTPTQSGTFPLQVRVQDSSVPSQLVTVNLSLVVAGAPALAVSATPLVDGSLGVEYAAGVGYIGGRAPYAWSVSSGSLPPGLTLEPASGMIVGVPTAAGSYPFTIRATDSSSPTSETSSADVKIAIEGPALAVASQSLPRATQGSPYTGTLRASGGTPPYTWALTAGSLPAGLKLEPLDGVISGTPTGPGTTSFTVRAVDSGKPVAALATGQASIETDPGSPLAIPSEDLEGGVQGSPYTQQLSAAGGTAPYSWSVVGGSLPAGLQLSHSGALSGTPTEAGFSSFTVRAGDSSTPGAALVEKTLSIDIEAIPAPTTTTTTTTTSTSAEDFSLTMDPPSQTLVPGASTTFQIDVGSVGSFAQPVALSVAGLPAGVSATFSPEQVTPNGVSLLTLTAASSITPGTYTLEVSGTSDGITHTVGSSVDLAFGLIPKCYGTITGTVTEAVTGAAILGATIGGFEGPPVQSDLFGDYTITDVGLAADNAPRNVSLVFAAPGYTTTELNATVGCGLTTTVDATMFAPKLGSLSGIAVVGTPDPSEPEIVVPSTTPLGGAAIKAASPPPPEPANSTGATVAGADGTFAFDSLPLASENGPALYGVSAGVSGYWKEAAQDAVVSLKPSPASRGLTLALVKICYGTIDAHVTNSVTGQPLPGASIAYNAGEDSAGNTLEFSGEANASGEIVLNDVPLAHNNAPAKYTLTPRPPFGVDAIALEPPSVTLSGCGATASLQLSMEVLTPVSNYGNLTGTVLDSVTDKPIAGANVFLGFHSQVTPADGTFTFDEVFVGLSPITQVVEGLTTAASGYYPSEDERVTITSGQTTTHVVKLVPEEQTTVQGTVTNSLTGAPVPNIEVSVEGHIVTTNASGFYTFTADGLLGADNAPGEVGVGVASGNGYWGASAEGTVTANQTTTINLQILPVCQSAAIDGLVLNADTGAPIENAYVQVDGQGVDQAARTDAGGRFSLSNLTVFENRPTLVSVTASATGFETQTLSPTIFCGAAISLNFGAPSSVSGTLTGTVTAQATGEPVPDAFIGTSYGGTTTTDADGDYTLTDVPLGTNGASVNVTVTAIPPTGSSLEQLSKSVLVGSGSTTLDLALPAPTVTSTTSTATSSTTQSSSTTTTTTTTSTETVSTTTTPSTSTTTTSTTSTTTTPSTTTTTTTTTPSTTTTTTTPSTTTSATSTTTTPGTTTTTTTTTPSTTTTVTTPSTTTTTASPSTTTTASSTTASAPSQAMPTSPAKGAQGAGGVLASRAIACTSAAVVLIDVLPGRSRVLLSGAARPGLAGQQVLIRLLATGKTVGHARIGANGTFSTSVPLPPLSFRFTNRARYEAVLDGHHSLALKLERRAYMRSAVRTGSRVRIDGFVTGAFRPETLVTIKLRVTCGQYTVVARVPLGRHGSFTAFVRAPRGLSGSVAVYRAQTTVLKDGHDEPTFTLPHPPT